MRSSLPSVLVSVFAVLACDFSGASPETDQPSYLTLSGTAVDFLTGDAVEIGSVEVLGPTNAEVSIDGSRFEVSNVLAFSVVHLLISAPGYASTISEGVVIEEDDAELTAVVVERGYAEDLALTYGVDAGSTLALVQALDENNVPREGLSGTVFGAVGAQPRFLDEFLDADPGRIETTGPSWLAFYGVPTGVLDLTAVVAPFVVRAPGAPIRSDTVTIIRAVVTEEELELPRGLSWKYEVFPILSARGCLQCHRKNEEGAVVGNLDLDKSNEAHTALVFESSPVTGGPRVNLNNPMRSLVLTKPSLESPSDGHPNATFASPLDEDYLRVLGWITDGAPRN